MSIQYVIQFQGRVQGVGFRYTCFRVSQQFAVTGWVKNCGDGSVLMTVEGDQTEIEDFLKSLHQEVDHHTPGRIDGTDIQTTPIEQPNFESFEIHR